MPDQKNAKPSRIDRLVRQAQWVLTVERVWPPLVFVAALLAVFIALSWLGLWLAVPRPIRVLGVGCLGFGLAIAVFALARARRPSRAEALGRLDRDSGLPHHPVSATEDQLANQGTDPTTRALWELHRKKLAASLAKIQVARPSPRMVDRDPYALRFLALLGLVAAGFIAGPGKEGLVASAFDWRGDAPAGPGFRVDAWIDPPGYTGRPPVILFSPDQPGATPASLTVPTRSTVVVRSAGSGSVEVKAEGALKPVEAPAAAPPNPGADRAADRAPPAAAKSDPSEKRFMLFGSGRLTLTHDGSSIGSVALQAIPDLPPTITLIGKPKPTARGSLTLAYSITDDYGVVGAEAAFSDPVLRDGPKGGRSLVPPPRMALGMPAAPGGLGSAQTTTDLSDHPWAGAEVTLVLSARDEGGNVGLSEPVRVVLPTRPFTNPLARAIVEQRRDLVFDPDHRAPIGLALDALMIAPDVFGTSNAVYLGLYTARQRLDAAKSDQDLVDLSDFLWQMALRIEDGDLSQAERDLRAAEQALREAMQKGASPDDIKRLTDALRQQMDKFLAEMMQRNQQADRNSRPDPNSRTVTPQDLQQMMKRMEEMAQSGNMAEAKRMLDQLQNILENLKTARNGSSDQATRELNRQMNELDRMTRDQQDVRNRTFKQGKQARRGQQQQPGAPQAGMPPQMGQGDDQDEDNPDQPDDQSAQQGQKPGDAPSDQDLQQQQQALRQRLQELQKRLRDLGMKGEKGLEDAEQAMKDAEGALAEGPGGNRRAVEAQGRALDGLQKGAGGLSQQMAQGQKPGRGEQPGEDGEGGPGDRDGQGMANGSDTDPLGRRREGRSAAETRGAEIGEGVAARAQRVLQELRRRLGDPNRSAAEQDYLERLMNRF